MRYISFAICFLVCAVCFGQSNVRASVRRITEAGDLSMQLTNVVKRDPASHRVSLNVVAVENLPQRFIREMAKAMERDSGKATHYETEMYGGTVTKVATFQGGGSLLNVVLVYGPNGGKLVVREDFVTYGTPARKRGMGAWDVPVWEGVLLDV